MCRQAGQSPGRRDTRPFPAVFGVLTGWPASGCIDCTMASSPIRLLKPREMLRTIALTGLRPCSPPRRSRLRRRRARRSAISFPIPSRVRPATFRAATSSSAPDDEEEVPELPQGRLLPTPNRPLPPAQAAPPPGSVQSQPLAPPPGTTVIPQNVPPGIAVAPPQPGQGVAVAPPGANPPPGAPAGRQPKSVPQIAGHAAARRRSRHRAAGAEDRQQEGEFFGAGQDHRPHHQFRRGYRRDRPVRRAAGQDRRLLYAPRDRGRQHRRLCRGRRDHAAGRGEADLFRLDVRGKPRPARRRAPDLRHLADRLQRSGHHRGHRGARPAEAAGAATAARAEACRAAEAGRRVRRRSRSSRPSNSSRRHRRPLRQQQPGGLFSIFRQ